MPEIKPWHSQSGPHTVIRVVGGLRTVTVFTVVLVLFLSAIFAAFWSNWRGLDAQVGNLQTRFVPPAWIKAKVESLKGGVDLKTVEVYKNGELVPGATVTYKGSTVDADGEPLAGILEYRSNGDVIKIVPTLVYPGGVERENMSKLPGGVVVVKNPVSFDSGGVYVNGEEVQSGVAFMGTDNGGEVTFTPLAATIQGRTARDTLQITNASGLGVDPVVGIATIEDVRLDGTRDEILAQPNNVRQLTPDGSSTYLLGTDNLGRDLATRMIHAARTSLTVSLIVVLLAGVVGTAIGLMAGYIGGWIDRLIMYFIVIYPLILAIFLFLVFLLYLGASPWTLPGLSLGPSLAWSWWPNLGPSVWQHVGISLSRVAMGISLLFWPLYALQVRGVILSANNSDIIRGARSAGTSHTTNASTPIFPKLLYVFANVAALQLGIIVLLEAFLSYMGIGIPRPIPSFGVIMADGRALVAANWWISFFPGLAILLASLSLFSFGEWARGKLASKVHGG